MLIYSQNERKSVPLTLGSEYRDIFTKFKEYMNYEIENRIQDNTMKQEIEILDLILKAPEKEETLEIEETDSGI